MDCFQFRNLDAMYCISLLKFGMRPIRVVRNGVLLFALLSCTIIAFAERSLDLGVVTYPDKGNGHGTLRSTQSFQEWREASVAPALNRMGYALSEAEQVRIQQTVNQFARETNYLSLKGVDGFYWRPPISCLKAIKQRGDNQEWCIYRFFASTSEKSIWPVAKRLIDRGRAGGFNQLQMASFIVSYVQAIPYQLQTKQPFGVLPPSLVAYEMQGDCDSKVLLAHMLLYAAGIRSILLVSNAHHHAVLGVALAVPGHHVDWQGVRYAMTELTAKMPLGQIDPRMLSPADWRPVAVYTPGRGR